MGKGGRCQVWNCKEKAKWICLPCKLRYCDKHKRGDSKDETFERIRR